MGSKQKELSICILLFTALFRAHCQIDIAEGFIAGQDLAKKQCDSTEPHRTVASFINLITSSTTSRDINVQHLNLFQLYNYCCTVLEFGLQSLSSYIPDSIGSNPKLDWISKSYFPSILAQSSRTEGIIPFQNVTYNTTFVLTNALDRNRWRNLLEQMLLFLSTQNTYLPRFLFFSEKKSNFALIINSILSEKKPNKNKSNQTTHTHKQTKPKISTVELK